MKNVEIKRFLVLILLLSSCSNTNTDWDINTTSIEYSNNQLPIGSELIDFNVNKAELHVHESSRSIIGEKVDAWTDNNLVRLFEESFLEEE